MQPNEKYDAEKTYKKINGYPPGIASIANMPVYIEGRNGQQSGHIPADGTTYKTMVIPEYWDSPSNTFPKQTGIS